MWSVLNSIYQYLKKPILFYQGFSFCFCLHWRGKEGKVVVSSICGQVEMFLLERGWTGGLARTDCGYGLFECDVNHDGDMAIQMDIRRCRVQQFR